MQDLLVFKEAVSPTSVFLRFENGDLKCSKAFLDTLSRFKVRPSGLSSGWSVFVSPYVTCCDVVLGPAEAFVKPACHAQLGFGGS